MKNLQIVAMAVLQLYVSVLLFAEQQNSTHEFVKEIRAVGSFDAAFQTKDGGYITVSIGHNPEGVLTLIKFSASGKKEWKNSVWSLPQHFPHIRDITQISDGYILVGGCYGTAFVPGLVIKLDNSGSVVWSKHISGPDLTLPEFDLYSVTVQPDGKFITLGVTSDDPANGANPVLIKFDPSGNILWTKRFSQFNNWEISSASTSNNGLILASTRYMDRNPVGVHLLKLNANGDSVWNRELRMAGFAPNKVRLTSDGGIVLLDSAATVVKLTSTGHFQWSARYSLHMENRYPNLWDAIQTTDGGYALAGSIEFFDWSRFATVVTGGIFIKIDQHGKVVLANEFGSGQGVTGSAIFPIANQGYTIFGFGSFESQLMLQVNSQGSATGCKYFKPAHSITPGFISGVKTSTFQLQKPSPTLFSVTDASLKSVNLKEEIETICE
jgi:hypothetical protein